MDSLHGYVWDREILYIIMKFKALTACPSQDYYKD